MHVNVEKTVNVYWKTIDVYTSQEFFSVFLLFHFLIQDIKFKAHKLQTFPVTARNPRIIICEK